MAQPPKERRSVHGGSDRLMPSLGWQAESVLTSGSRVDFRESCVDFRESCVDFRESCSRCEAGVLCFRERGGVMGHREGKGGVACCMAWTVHIRL
eukprot:147882-Rhodomonas_salina.1